METTPKENLVARLIEKAPSVRCVVPSTLSHFYGEGFLFKHRCKFAADTLRDLRSKITNTKFSDVSAFAEEVFNIFDVIQSVDKVNTS